MIITDPEVAALTADAVIQPTFSDDVIRRIAMEVGKGEDSLRQTYGYAVNVEEAVSLQMG